MERKPCVRVSGQDGRRVAERWAGAAQVPGRAVERKRSRGLAACWLEQKGTARCMGRESNPGLPRGRREFYH